MFSLSRFAVLVLFTGSVFAQIESGTRLVNIAQGPVQGHIDSEGSIYTFYNIPYATAPTGNDKFKAPLDPPEWTEVFDAVDRNIICPQPFNTGNVQEDCLVANVFVPNTEETNLHVLVYIHGGAYQYLFGNIITLNSLVKTNKVIVVSFNYRLGAHGFLCLGTESVPGNAGFKDQVALLRWVKTNIRSFGGNPEEVTIMGCSAGGGSVDILTLSSIASGLFKRAIVESGAAIGFVGVQGSPIANAQNYARLLNFHNVDDLSALEDFYKTASHETLYSQHLVTWNSTNSTIVLGPCVERDVGQEIFMDDAPINIIRQGKYNKVPLLYGYANMEGLFRMEYFESWKNMMNENFANFLPGELYFESEEGKEEVANMVKSFYFGDDPVSVENVLKYIDYFTDVLFGYPMLNILKERLESLGDTIYLYEYSFVDENTPSIPHTDVKGANHCDQSFVIMDEDKGSMSEDYLKMKAVLREYWLSFILTGSPFLEGSELPQWPPANANRGPYMSLGQTVELKNILEEKRVALWDSIYEKYYRVPMPPNSANILEFKFFYLMVAICLGISYL